MSTKHVQSSSGAAACIQPDYERPVTPPELRRFRKTSNIEPGKHNIHWGMANDPVFSPNKNVQNKDQNDNVAAALASSGTSVLKSYMNEKKESIYASNKREPLGKAPKAKDPLPEFVKDKEFFFGTKSSIFNILLL